MGTGAIISDKNPGISWRGEVMTSEGPEFRPVSWTGGVALAAIVLAGFVHGGCTSDRSDSSNPGGVYLASIVLSSDPVSVQVGTTSVVSALGIDSEGNIVPVTVTWTISPTGYASVDDAGVVTGVAPGLTTLTARSTSNSNVKKTALVNVTTTPPGPPDIITTVLTAAYQGQPYSFQIVRINGA